eukprot:TRINITY_DN4702_c0_g1_i1.p1 TRINITY_DN4702_c0_g1~~TRINITY_DN4702_c0_g1_i1.p1  ORF type:complete len:303 (+),score=95.87 TRINITY_DN4702_c0_g1_i1:11-919(+)
MAETTDVTSTTANEPHKEVDDSNASPNDATTTKETTETTTSTSSSSSSEESTSSTNTATNDASSSSTALSPSPSPSPSAASASPHAFESEWTIWYDKKPSKQTSHGNNNNNNNNSGNTNTDEQKINYQENLKKLGCFSDIEQFWALYSHLAAPSDLTKNSNYHIFRGDVLPMWESFPQGGCWNVRVPKSLRATRTLTRLWDSLVLTVIGETFEEPDVVGINVCIRGKDDVISVWTRDSKARSRYRIGEKLKKELIELKVPAGIEYKHHVTSMKDRSTFRNAQPWSPRTSQSASNPRHKKEKK